MAEVKEAVDKLGHDNYYAWSCQVQAILDSRELWEAVEAGWKEEELETCTAAQRKANKNALAYIKRSVDPIHLESIGNLKSAKEAWETLRTAFVVRDEFQQMIMMKSLMRMEKDNETTICTYINRVVAAHRELSETGLISFNDRTVALIVLMGLPEEYKDCVKSLTRDTKLSVKTLIPILRSEESKLKMEREDKIAKGDLRGYVARRSYNSNKPQQNSQSQVQCHACRQAGHYARECPKVLDAKSRGTVLCYACGKEGHASTKCRVKNTVKSSNSSGQRESNSGVEQSDSAAKQIGSKLVRFKAFMGSVNREEYSSDPCRWALDTGCNAHATPHRELFESFSPTSGTMSVAKKGQACAVKGVGSVTMRLVDEHGGWTLKLRDVYWVPDSSDNLISVRQLEKKGVKFTIDDGWFYGIDKSDGQEIIRAHAVEDDLYVVDVDWYVNPSAVSSMSNEIQSESVLPASSAQLTTRRAVTREMWHERFVHANNLPDCDIIPKGAIEDCDTCFQGKAKKLPFPQREERSTSVLNLVFSDVCQVNPETKNGARYFVTFIDDYSRFSEVEILKRKSDVFEAFVSYKNRVENLTGCKIRNFQSDGGGEYISDEFSEYLEQHGIKRRLSMAGAHQQMGVAERLNQQLLTSARCMLIHAGMPHSFWGEAVVTACYVKNLCKSRAIDDAVPNELFFCKSIDVKEIERMRVFGCRAWMYIENPKGDKMKPRAVECVMLGYPRDRRGYKLWNVKGKCVVLSRDVRFQENVFPMKLNTDVKTPVSVKPCVLLSDDSSAVESSESEIDSNDGSDDESGDENYGQNVGDENDGQNVGDENDGQNVDDENVGQNVGDEHDVQNVEIPEPHVPRRSTRERKHVGPCVCCRSASVNSCENCDPKTVSEALQSENKNEWLKAMEEEMLNHKVNSTWDLVKRPEKCKLTGCKWVFKTKRDQDGNVEKFKARLVAQGYNQIQGVDFSETFSPVVSRKVIRLMTALMVENEWDCHHVDVKSAYLNSEIKENIFIKQPEGFIDQKCPDFVCKLNRSMYGLKQAGRDWNEHLHKVLTDLKLCRAVSDRCLYYHECKNLFVTVYVDDLGVWGEHKRVECFIKLLSQKLEIRDLGFPTNFLSVKYEKCSDGTLKMNQINHVKNVLFEHGLENCKGLRNPLPIPSKNQNVPKFSNVEPCDVTMYRSAVGSVRYIANVTRPDIMYSVCKVSQKCENPTKEDWINVKHLLRYLQNTKELSLCFYKTGEPIKVYVDASWAQDKDNPKSITGFTILLGGAAVIWKSVTQKRVAVNNNESEVIAMVDVLNELRWLNVFLQDVSQEKFMPKPCVVHADNMGGILIAKGEGVSDRTRHCVVEAFALQTAVEENFVKFMYVPTDENIADVLTKVLPAQTTAKFTALLGLC